MTRRRWRLAELLEGDVGRHAGGLHQAASIMAKMRLSAPGHRATAPSASVRSGSRKTPPDWLPTCTPNPSQAGHQPNALLNEKLCGESGSKLRPQRPQAKCWLWTSTGHSGSG